MKKSLLGILSILMIVFFVFQPYTAYALSASAAPSSDEVTITNNVVGTADSIYVTGVMTGDIVNVYNAATGGKIICKATVGANKTDLTIKIAQIGALKGSVYISVMSKGMTESSRTKMDYDSEPVSNTPLSSGITVTNNSGKADTIYVSGLIPGDAIKIYNKATGGGLLGTATVGANTTDVTKSFTQLGVAGGSVYISVKSKGMLESDRVGADFSAENYSSAPIDSNITITNNSGKADTVNLSGLNPGDIVKIYTVAVSGNLFGTATVPSNTTEVTKSFTQLGITSGTLYISVTSLGMHESTRTPIVFSAENQSNLVLVRNVTITNNTGKVDTIYVDGLSPKDKVNVYTVASGGTTIATGTVAASGFDVTINVSQLGKTSGTVYLSVTSSGTLESGRTGITYNGELQSTLVDSSNILITNNVGTADTVTVSDFAAGDVIKVYDALTGGNLLGTATVAAMNTAATASISRLGTSAGTVYVSVTSTNKIESSRIATSYAAEGQSNSIGVNNIIVSNNSGKADTVYASTLAAGDVVNVYDNASGGTLLGTATVAAGSTSATVSIAQLGTGSGSVYVSITSTNKIKSSRTQSTYAAEGSSTIIDISNIVVTNNAGQPDTVQVGRLSDNEIINVYDAARGGNLIGTATVAKYSSEATITIAQIGSQAGDIYVSRTSTNKIESARVDVKYAAEGQSSLVDAINVSITNNSGMADTVKVTGLSANDIVNIYDLAKGGNLLGTATVASGGTDAIISIPQLGTTAGSVYVLVTSTNKSQSDRAKVDYSAEPTSNTPAASSIVVANNAGITDTVKVTGLSATDIVNVYDSATGGTLLGTETIASYATSATVSINQIGTGSGSVYVSVISTSKLESGRTQVGFIAESKSHSPVAKNVVIVNNAGIAGTVTVNGISGGDIINVYNAAVGGTLLGTATVGTYDTEATISVTQLGSVAGEVYVSTTSTGKLESDRTVISYAAKLVSSAPDVANITVVNNATIPGTVALIGLQPNDVVNIYSSATGTLLATATVPAASRAVTLTLTQLGISGGNIYVSVKSTGKAESARTPVTYNAESKSDALAKGDITLVNNSGKSDTINVTGLSSKDIVKAYSSATGGTLLGTATVASGDSDVTISISQLGTIAGSVYLSVIRYGDTESARTQADYVSESISLLVGNVSIVNNAVLADTVTVNGVTANDIVNVYDAAGNGNLLGSAVVSNNNNSVIVTIPQLNTNAGSAYISVANFGKGESSRIKVNYTAEQDSTAVFAGNVSIVNSKVNTPDTITVNNLIPSSLVKVYDASTGGNLIGIATASSNGTQITITISQLNLASGSVYISVTIPGKNESSRTKADYVAEN
ncbi:hypothetical protein G9F71_018055 [Clostridium sp. FP2]|uniref:beta strand repeat-containing protein n=1 Tax=Clostridium sp. FP2 TaxID=2724481 RepID=UPI0013E98B6E|nr:hypothetical protein [Clostridium sp. FP2]MBZ9624754.1 hypothetical protein [Clostridium sp. FP2]